jgi:hypothetical protein
VRCCEADAKAPVPAISPDTSPTAAIGRTAARRILRREAVRLSCLDALGIRSSCSQEGGRVRQWLAQSKAAKKRAAVSRLRLLKAASFHARRGAVNRSMSALRCRFA